MTDFFFKYDTYAHGLFYELLQKYLEYIDVFVHQNGISPYPNIFLYG